MSLLSTAESIRSHLHQVVPAKTHWILVADESEGAMILSGVVFVCSVTGLLSFLHFGHLEFFNLGHGFDPGESFQLSFLTIPKARLTLQHLNEMLGVLGQQASQEQDLIAFLQDQGASEKLDAFFVAAQQGKFLSQQELRAQIARN